MKEFSIKIWDGSRVRVSKAERNFFQRVILLTIRQLKAEIDHRDLWRQGVATRKVSAFANETRKKIEGMRETFFQFFPDMYDAYIQIVERNERIYRLELQLKYR